MKYIMTFFWTIILVTMLNYVVGSVQGVAKFELMHGLYMAVPAAIIILLITAIIPNEPAPTHDHH